MEHGLTDQAESMIGQKGANIDPIWFGVVIVVVCQAGMIAPPVGLNVFVISGMVRDVPMEQIYRGILPFLAAMVLLLGILMLIPDLALYLPRTMR